MKPLHYSKWDAGPPEPGTGQAAPSASAPRRPLGTGDSGGREGALQIPKRSMAIPPLVSAVITRLPFPAERPRCRSHHLRRDHQVAYGVRDTLELDLTWKPYLLQVVLAGCEEAAAAARASERPAICPWVETAQRPTRTRKSGNTQLQEAPSCFEAEVMEEDRAHSGLQTHEHVGLSARACPRPRSAPRARRAPTLP